MPLPWKSKSNEIHKQWVDAIGDVSDDLNDWESNFILDISIRVHGGLPLSQRQEEILERIYSEKTK